MEAGKRTLLFSNRDLINLIIPLALDGLLNVFVGLADSTMVSIAGETAVSAVSLVDAINTMINSILIAIAVGGSVVTSQYLGRKDQTKAKISANQLLYLNTSLAFFLMAVMLCFRNPLLHLIYGTIDAELFRQASVYFLFTLFSYPFFAVGYSCVALLRSMAKTRLSTALTVSVNLLNVVGNAILIYGCKMGVTGAAISTTFSRVIYAVVGLALLHRKHLPVYFENLLKFRLDKDIMKRVLRIGSANGLENGLVTLGKLLVSSLISTFGTVATAAYSVAFSICNIGWILVVAFSNTALIVVGQAIGAGEADQAKHYTKQLTIWSTVFMLVSFCLIFLLRHPLVLLFNFSPETLKACAYYVGVGALFTIFSLFSFTSVLSSSFRASGDIRYTVILSSGSMFLFRVAMSYILSGLFGMGLMSVWIGMFFDWGVRSILNIFHYHRGKWLTKKLV